MPIQVMTVKQIMPSAIRGPELHSIGIIRRYKFFFEVDSVTIGGFVGLQPFGIFDPSTSFGLPNPRSEKTYLLPPLAIFPGSFLVEH